MADDDFDSEGDAGEPASAIRAGATNSQKRKHNEEVSSPRASKRAAKRKKRNATKKEAHWLDDIDTELGINRAIARMDPSLMADFIARQTKRFEPDLSLVELEDRRIPAAAFADTSNWSDARILDKLPSFLEAQSGMSREEMCNVASDTKGTPHTLVITAAGLRAADIARALRIYQTKNATVAKLFAKHIKLKDAVEFTKSTRINIGIGTPQRLLDLVKHGALSLHSIKHIVVDASHVDEKRRGILDMRETLAPLIQMLLQSDLRQKYTDSRVRTMIF